MVMVLHSLGHRKMVIEALNDKKIIHCLPFLLFHFQSHLLTLYMLYETLVMLYFLNF